MTWLLAITLAHFPIHTNADVRQESMEFCRGQTADADECHTQPCPCNPAYKTLARFSDPNGGLTLCACGSQQRSLRHNRQLAAEACEKYRITYRQPCFISRGRCPQGFEALQSFAGSDDNKFTACRDTRHEQPKPDLRALPTMAEYDQLVSILENARQGARQSLPASTIEQLSPYFRGLALDRVTITHTKALSKGCFTDCEHIYCASAEPIDSWTRPQNPLLSRLLLHQIAHVESCEREGGRERYVSHWLHYLPDAVRQKLLAGKSINADEIHFAMYMERYAETRAESLCLTIPGCRME